MWLLDGGKANLMLAIDILNSAGANVEVAAIAKEKIDGKAHRAKSSANDLLYTKDKILKLPSSDKRLQFLQNLRDEAHRFAVTFHRKQKGKKDREIELMKLKGIKEAKIKRLLDYFGSFEAIRKADMEELSNAISQKDAASVYEYYRNQNA
jgi:excinuclease ABC subunit C